jgi:predicted transcriptional regulator
MPDEIELESGIKIRKRKAPEDSRIEREIVTLMITSNQFLEKIEPIESTEFFQADFSRDVSLWCLDYWKRYKRAPVIHIEDLYRLKESEIAEDKAGLIKTFLQGLSDQDIDRTESLNPDFVLDRAKAHFRLVSKKDLSHDISKAKDHEGVRAAYDRYNARIEKIQGQIEGSKIVTMAELAEMKFDPMKWAIQDIIPEGLTVFGGPAKIGKSLLDSNIGLAVSTGGEILGRRVRKGSVLYLALEDPLRRVQDRVIRKMMGGKGPFPNNFHVAPQGSWPRMPEGLNRLEKEIQAHPDMRLVLIDTWQRFKPEEKDGDRYSIDYNELFKVKEMADRHKVAIMATHHTRKTEAEDVFDMLLGSRGITAAPDGLIVLARSAKGQANHSLHIRGRETDEKELALKLDGGSLTWELLGDAKQVMTTSNRQILFDAIRNNGNPMSPSELAEVTDLKIPYIKTTLPYMIKDGSIQKIGRGKYDIVISKEDRIREAMKQRQRKTE